MATYNLLTATAAMTANPPPVGAALQNICKVDGASNPNMAAQSITAHYVVTATAGNASGTAQIVGSNDGVNWVLVGNALIAPSTYLTAQQSASIAAGYLYYGAYQTAIAGIGATGTLKINA